MKARPPSFSRGLGFPAPSLSLVPPRAEFFRSLAIPRPPEGVGFPAPSPLPSRGYPSLGRGLAGSEDLPSPLLESPPLVRSVSTTQGRGESVTEHSDDAADGGEEKFGRVLGVLQSQMRWEQRHKQQLLGEGESNRMGDGESVSSQPAPPPQPWQANKARVLDKAHRGAAWSLLLYATDGTTAGPKALERVLKLRASRAVQRTAGLVSMRELVCSALSSESEAALLGALAFLRPDLGPAPRAVTNAAAPAASSSSSATSGASTSAAAPAGTTPAAATVGAGVGSAGNTTSTENGALQAASLKDGDSSGGGDGLQRIRSRHHPLKGLEGSGSCALDGVGNAFASLYSSLVVKLFQSPSSATATASLPPSAFLNSSVPSSSFTSPTVVSASVVRALLCACPSTLDQWITTS